MQSRRSCELTLTDHVEVSSHRNLRVHLLSALRTLGFRIQGSSSARLTPAEEVPTPPYMRVTDGVRASTSSKRCYYDGH
ncbi:unnamed protein product, partial [Brenthis ino]